MQGISASNLILPLLLSTSVSAESVLQNTTNNNTVELDKITITSQRVERNAQNIPSNISVIDAKQIENLGAETVSDVVKTLPNVSLQDIPGDYSYFQIRGLPRNGEQSNVPVYVDGVPYTSLYGLNLSLLDVDQMEFIRGPQGNLFGANARDGLLAITTKLPSEETEGRVQLSAGNQGYRKLQFVGSSPVIANDLYGNLSFEKRQRDGFVDNTFLNKPVDDLEDQTLRLGLFWEPSERFNARLSIDTGKRDGGVYNYVADTPKLEAGDDLETAFNDDHILDQDFQGGSLSMNWQVTPDWELSSVTGVRKVDTFGRFDADLSTLPYGYYDTFLDEKDVFQEIRLSSTPGSRAVDWLFGLSYFNSQDDNRNSYPLFMSETLGEIERDTYTAFSNAVWQFTPKWTLETGLRYTSENLDMYSRFDNPSMPMPSAVTDGKISNNFREWLPKAAISYNPSNNQTIYLSYGKGMLSGGGTWMQEDTDATGVRKGNGIIYDPEISTNLELGYKAYLPESRSSVNLALYQMDIEDYQHAYPDSLFLTRISSVDRVRSQGAEASFTTWVMDNLQAMVSFGYNDAKVDDIDGVTGATTLTSIQEGDRVPNAPKYNASIQLSHEMPLAGQWNMRNNLAVNYFGETAFDFGSQLKQEKYGLLNLNTSFDYADNLSIRLWAKNITDERYQIYRVNLGGVDIASYGTPRTFGIDVISRF